MTTKGAFGGPMELTVAEEFGAALVYIRDKLGQVCEQYEVCEHAACSASYSAWSTADEALRRVKERWPR